MRCQLGGIYLEDEERAKMKAILGLTSMVLFCLVGLVCLFMAYKTIRAKKFLPFHEETAGKKWEELDSGMQETILALTTLSGLGFLITGLLLSVIFVIGYFHSDRLVLIAIPILAILFCARLSLLNYRLYKRTNANTPWQSSLVALGILIVAFGLSFFIT
jgi:hypothetical protein